MRTFFDVFYIIIHPVWVTYYIKMLDKTCEKDIHFRKAKVVVHRAIEILPTNYASNIVCSKPGLKSGSACKTICVVMVMNTFAILLSSYECKYTFPRKSIMILF